MYRLNDQTRQMAYNFSLPITSPVNSTMTSAGFYDSSSYHESYSVSTPIVTSPIDNPNYYLHNVSPNGLYNDSWNYQNYLNSTPIVSSSIVDQNRYYLNQINNMESTHVRSTLNPPNYIERQDSLMPSILSTRRIHINPSILLLNHQTRHSNRNPPVSSPDTDSYTNDSQSSQYDYEIKTKSSSDKLKRKSSRDKKSPRRTASLATISRKARRRRSRKRSDALKEYVDKIRAIDDSTKKIKPKCIDARVLLNAKAKFKDHLSTITNNLIDVLASRTQSVDKAVSSTKLDTRKKNSLPKRNNRFSPIRYDDSEDSKNTLYSSKNNQRSSVTYKPIKIEKTEVYDHEAPWD